MSLWKEEKTHLSPGQGLEKLSRFSDAFLEVLCPLPIPRRSFPPARHGQVSCAAGTVCGKEHKSLFPHLDKRLVGKTYQERQPELSICLAKLEER